MAITKFKETRRSKVKNVTADAKTASREYMLWYASHPDEVETYLNANIPSSFFDAEGDELVLNAYDIAPNDKDERVFTARVDFSTAPEQERSGIGDETVSFDLSSQTVKTVSSPLTVNKYAISGSTAPDFQGGIGFDGKKCEGTDVFVEQFAFSVTKILANASVTNAFIASLRDTAFRWNSSIYRGQAAGECLFAGASGSPRDAKTYSINFKFLCSKNQTGLVRGGVSGITKQGWDYLWTLFADVEDTAAKIITPRPLAVYVERLYTSANFQAALGLN